MTRLRALPIRRMPAHLLALCLLVVVASGCSDDKLSKPTLSGSASGNAGDFTRTVFIGDSLTAGFQSDSLLDAAQVNGYAALIAQQAKFSLNLPLMAPPGVPSVLQLVSPGPPPVTQPAPGTSKGRDDLTLQPTDLAVPGHTLNDLLNTAPKLIPSTPEDTITYLILGFPGIDQGVQFTQLQWAEQLNPTTLFVWIGNNDALIADITGTPASMTPVDTFSSQYAQLMKELTSKTRANLIVANIPDVTDVAYMTPGAALLALFSAQTGIPAATISAATGIGATDLVNTDGLAQMEAILGGTQPGPVTDSGFLTAAETAAVKQTVIQYNQVIAQDVASAGGTLVDVYSASKGLGANPPTINGYKLNFGFLGGFFSLDGIHPTNTGYALTANVFIDTMNAALKTTIPEVDVSAVAAKDPLFPPNLSMPAQQRTHIPVRAGKSLKWMFAKQLKK
jgi:lysophospholipase L1-like esterase